MEGGGTIDKQFCRLSSFLKKGGGGGDRIFFEMSTAQGDIECDKTAYTLRLVVIARSIGGKNLYRGRAQQVDLSREGFGVSRRGNISIRE